LLLTSGLAPLLALRSRYTVIELLVLTPLASVVLWSMLGLVGGALPGFVLACAPVVIAGLLATLELRRARTIALGAGPLDAVATTVAILVAVPVVAVFTHNGLIGTNLFEARSWFKADTFYFAALAQMHVATGGAPHENPFVGGAPNLYPSLLHGGIGELARLGGVPVPIALDVVAPVLLIASVAAVPLVIVRTVDDTHRARGAWLAGALTVVFVMLRVDLFVYPHTHSLVFGWLVLGAAFLLPAARSPAPTIAGALTLAALPFAHTVTGSVAVVLVASCGLSQLRDRTTRPLGAAMLVGSVLVAIMAARVYALPFPSARISAAPTGALGMVAPYLEPWRLVLIAVALICVASLRTPSRIAAPLVMLALAAAYYSYGAMLGAGDRWFVHYNAERFIHYALFVSFFAPSLARPLVAASAIGLVVVGLLVSPPRITRAAIGLVEQAPLRLGQAELEAFEAIRTQTPPRARIISELGHFALPAFTGRAQAAIEGGTLWTTGTLPAGETDTLARERARFFGAPPAERLRIARRRGYTHALVAQVIAPSARASFATRFLSDGSARVVYGSPKYLLVALPNAARRPDPPQRVEAR